MASEKQVDYINSLIAKMQPENHPAWKTRDNYVDEADRQRGERQARHVRQQEMMRALNLRHLDIDEISYDEVAEQYNARLGDLAGRDWAAADSREASAAIDALKQYSFPK